MARYIYLSCFFFSFYVAFDGIYNSNYDIIFPPKPRETFLQNHEYKIVKFIRSGGDYGAW
jgi:hypothetical protein